MIGVILDFPRCDRCGDAGCKIGEPGKFKSCPTNVSEITKEEIIERYQDPETKTMMQAAAKVERGTLQPVNGVLTPIRPRISEIDGIRRPDGVEEDRGGFLLGRQRRWHQANKGARG